MADQYYTYTPPAKTAVPAGALPDYSPYVNNNGTISNTKTGTVYTNPTQLAGDLGINASTIDWSKIALGGAAGYAADQATAPGSPTNPNTPIPLPPTTSINSSNTAPQNPITPVAPVTTPVPNVSGLGSVTTPTLQITPQEQQAQDITTRLTQLNDSLVGKSAYQTQENTQFGVDTAQATINDLNAKLTGLKNEQASIPLQLQQGASDRGVTTPVLGRQENSRLRTNAIAALGVSSLMAAAQGQLANAQSLADRAVSAKYDPIQEAITAATNNLQLIINSPEYTLAEKNRALQQLDIQNKKQDALDLQKSNAAEVLKIAIQAASDGADAVTLQNIQNATSPVQAAQLAAVVTKQKANKAAIAAAGINTPYVNVNGEIQDAKTGIGFKTEQDFLNKTGMLLSTAMSKGLVSDLKPMTTAANTEVVEVNGQKVLIDSRTGNTVKVLGSATTPGAGPDASGVAVGTTGSANINSATPGYTTQIVSNSGGLTQAIIDQAALQFALTGNMPSIGLGGTGAAGQKRTAILNRAGELNTGGNIQSNQAQLKSLQASLTQQVEYANTVERALSNAEAGLNQLTSAFSGKINDSNITVANALANAAKYQLNPNDVASFRAGLAEVASEYTQVFSRGGQVSDSTRNKAQSILDGNISISALKDVSSELQAQGKIVVDGANSQVQSIQQDINGIIGGSGNTGSSSNSQASTTPVGGTVIINGTVYLRTGQDTFVPVGSAK